MLKLPPIIQHLTLVAPSHAARQVFPSGSNLNLLVDAMH